MSGVLPEQGCERFEDSYDLYVLGSLEETEANAFAEHLQAGCVHCEGQLQRALSRTQAISQAVPLVDPPDRLRRRFASSIGARPDTRGSWVPWLVALAASFALAALGVWILQARRPEPLQPSQAPESARVSSMIEILAAPGTVEVPLTETQKGGLHGALYVHKKLGLAMVVNGLPVPPSGWVYESWITPRNGAPQAIESFKTDVHGRAVTVLRGPVEVGQVGSMLISMEPVGSASAKPTTLVFSGEIKRAG